jgi:hypothetical protein
VETATQALHRLTSYQAFDPGDPERVWEPPVDDPRVRQDLVVNDVARLPWFYKRYTQPLPRVPLPRHLPVTTAPAVEVLAGTADLPRAALDLPQLSRLLHLSAGVVRTTERSYGTYLFRAAGSAGGRFPMELYLAVPESARVAPGARVPAGVHWYHPQDHALVQVGPPPHVYWDVGTMLSQLLAAAESAGITARLHSRFPDEAVTALVGADGVHEWPAAVVVLGDGTPALDPAGPAAAGAVDAAPVEFPLITAAQRAGEQDTLGLAWDRGAPAEVPVHDGPPVEAVVLSRGSQRLMDPSGGLPQTLLRTSLAVSLRGVTVPHWVVVHNVDGLTPGLYRAAGLSAPARAGQLRDELYHVCLDQGLGRDAAFVVLAATDISALDDREYREAQLAAGLVEGRLHLLAYALGASASGMTCADSLIPALLGQPLDGLLLTCVGVAEYASAAGGMPGAATPVRQVTPRF